MRDEHPAQRRCDDDLDPESKGAVEAKQIARVDEHPRTNQPLEVDPLNMELEPEVDGDAEVVAVVEEGRASTSTERETSCKEGIRAQRQVELAYASLDPIRTKTEVD